jgi:hypothetical protein
MEMEDCRKGCIMRRGFFIGMMLILTAALICPLAAAQAIGTTVNDTAKDSVGTSVQYDIMREFYQDHPDLFFGSFAIMLLALGVITLLGLLAVYHGIKELEVESSGNKNYKSIFIILVGLIIFLAGLYYLTTLFFQPFVVPQADSTDSKAPPMWALIGISTLVFLMLIGIGTWRGSVEKLRDMDQGQIRSAIAGTLVFGFIMLTLFSLYYGVAKDNIIVAQYGNFVGIVIGFYFGARTASQAASEGADIAKGLVDDGKASKKIKLESAKLLEDKKSLELYVFNGTDKPQDLKEVNAGDQTATALDKTALEKGKATKIVAKFDSELKNGKYRVRLSTKSGESAEICIMIANGECAPIKCSEVTESSAVTGGSEEAEGSEVEGGSKAPKKVD